MSSIILPVYLDEEMLRRNGAQIAPKETIDEYLKIQWRRSGKQLAQELGNRYLIYYMLGDDISTALQQMNLGNRMCYLTPTALRPNELSSALNLPRPMIIRRFAILVEPTRLPVAFGPRYVDAGFGLEYLANPSDLGNALKQNWPMDLGE